MPQQNMQLDNLQFGDLFAAQLDAEALAQALQPRITSEDKGSDQKFYPPAKLCKELQQLQWPDVALCQSACSIQRHVPALNQLHMMRSGKQRPGRISSRRVCMPHHRLMQARLLTSLSAGATRCPSRRAWQLMTLRSSWHGRQTCTRHPADPCSTCSPSLHLTRMMHAYPRCPWLITAERSPLASGRLLLP